MVSPRKKTCTKDELLLKCLRRKYLFLLMATFGISKQHIRTSKS